MTMTNEEKKRAISCAALGLRNAIVARVEAGGEGGVPGGTLYARLMEIGFSLEQFERIMQALVASRQVEKRGQLYFGRGK